jgi:hypothetical protein
VLIGKNEIGEERGKCQLRATWTKGSHSVKQMDPIFSLMSLGLLFLHLLILEMILSVDRQNITKESATTFRSKCGGTSKLLTGLKDLWNGYVAAMGGGLTQKDLLFAQEQKLMEKMPVNPVEPKPSTEPDSADATVAGYTR